MPFDLFDISDLNKASRNIGVEVNAGSGWDDCKGDFYPCDILYTARYHYWMIFLNDKIHLMKKNLLMKLDQ